MRWTANLMISLYSLGIAQAETEIGDIQQHLDLSGSVRAGYFSSSRTLDGKKNAAAGSLWLKAAPHLGHHLSLVAEGWIRNDDIGNDSNQSKLREGYVNFAMDNIDIRIGKQIIVWGRADRFNPTDNLAPRDYRLLTTEDDDQRLGTTATKLSYRFPGIDLSVYWLPKFEPHGLPIAPDPGIIYTENVPDFDQNAIKLDRSGGDIDWSISYFSGLNLNPDFEIGAIGPSGLNIALTYNRIRVLGTDAATVIGRYGLRAEAAYTWTSDDRGDYPLVTNPFLYAVVGGDRTFLGYLNLNVQYYFRHVSNYRDPNEIADPLLRSVAIQGAVLARQLEEFEHGITLRIANKWRHETLEAEISTIYSFTYHDYAIRPKLVYSFDDHWKGSLGADIYRGSNTTFFGQLRDNSLIFGEIKYSF